MFDSAQAFTRYRLEVVRSWPDGDVKDTVLAAIESSLRKNDAGRRDRPKMNPETLGKADCGFSAAPPMRRKSTGADVFEGEFGPA
jgi:hypothetical protein